MKIGVKDGEAVTVRGDEEHPVNLGKLCPKGLSEHQFLRSPNRALRPLVKRNGKFEAVSWEAALEEMTSRFLAVQAKYGPNALGVLSTGQLVTEEFYALGKLVQMGFKTTNYDGNTTLCMASAVAGYKSHCSCCVVNWLICVYCKQKCPEISRHKFKLILFQIVLTT